MYERRSTTLTTELPRFSALKCPWVNTSGKVQHVADQHPLLQEVCGTLVLGVNGLLPSNAHSNTVQQ